ncbi:serine hydrolase domain-containing protein [Litorimonas cladophorae]|nr:serine hydrolase [Litorimonas cladophorae]
MMRIFKWIGMGLAALVALGLLLLALNWTTVKRLMTVNTLFDADNIVTNFSNMDAAFLHHDLTIGEPQPWEEDVQPLPETVNVQGEELILADVLTELDTTALVIIRDGKLIHESYYKDTGPDDLRISWSVAKSFMSGLYGQAIEDGLMDISKPIEFYLPQLKGTAYEGATVANILNMASGVKFNEDYMDPKSDINDMGRVLGLGGSMDEYTETLKDRQYEPGTVWQYVSIDTHVAAMALRKVTGKSLHQLWEDTYGENLGMGKSPFYLTDGEDVAFALGGLNLRTRDYAKFGQLFLQGGEWQGEQLVPEAWVKDSTINHAPNVHPIRGSGYGYQWWVPMPQEGPSKGDFFAVGIYGQYIYVNPAMNIVIAKNAADREFTVEQSNGQHSMNMNIDMFRSLAEQLAIRQKTDLDAEALRQDVKVWLKNSQHAPFLIHAVTDDIENGRNFAEVFGIARSKDGAFDELLEMGWLDTDSALPNADELEIIWKTMLEEIKSQRELSKQQD